MTKHARSAVVWYERAANQGVVDAMYELARCYLDGAFFHEDLEMAKQWLTKAYKANHLSKIVATPTVTNHRDVLRLLMAFENRPVRHKGAGE